MSRYVYFAQARTDGGLKAVKIGVAKNPRARVRELQCGSPTRIRLLAYVGGDVELERRLHRTFDPVCLCGEWFARTGKLDFFLNYLEFDVEEHPESLEVSFARFEVAISDNVANASWIPPCRETEEEWEESANRSLWAEYE